MSAYAGASLAIAGILDACAPPIRNPDILKAEAGNAFSPLAKLLKLPDIPYFRWAISSNMKFAEPAVALSYNILVGATNIFIESDGLSSILYTKALSPLTFFKGDTATEKMDFITADHFGPEFNTMTADPCAVLLPDKKVGFVCLLSDSDGSVDNLGSFVYNQATDRWTAHKFPIPDANRNGIDKPWAIWDDRQRKGYLTLRRNYSKFGDALDLYTFDHDLNLSSSRIATLADDSGRIRRGLPTVVCGDKGASIIYLRRDTAIKDSASRVYEAPFDTTANTISSEREIVKDQDVRLTKRDFWWAPENLSAVSLSDGSLLTTIAVEGNIFVSLLPPGENNWKTYKYPLIDHSNRVVPFGGQVNPIVVGRDKIILSYLAGNTLDNMHGYARLLSIDNLRPEISYVVGPLFHAPPDIGDYAQSISRGTNFAHLIVQGNTLGIEIYPRSEPAPLSMRQKSDNIIFSL